MDTGQSGPFGADRARDEDVISLEDGEPSLKDTVFEAFALVDDPRSANSAHSIETVLYVTSLEPGDVGAIAESIRKRWEIENKLHWGLDVTFREDRSRIRVLSSAQNFTRVRHIAFNALTLVCDEKRGYDAKRKRASMDEKFLTRVLRLEAK